MENKFPRQGHHSRGCSAVPFLQAGVGPCRTLSVMMGLGGGGGGGLTQFSTLKPFYNTVINFVLYFAA